MKKLFIVVNNDWFFLSHRKEIAVRAAEAGYSVTIVARDTGKKQEITALGLDFADLKISPVKMNIISEIQTLWFLYRLYSREKPDIVHHVGLKTILWGSVAARISGIKAVLNAVSGLGILFNDVDTFINRVILRILRWCNSSRKMIYLFQNNDDRELFIDKGSVTEYNALITNGSGVDLNEFAYCPEPVSKKIRVLLSSRMIKEKGIKELIDAALLLKKDCINRAEFFICGKLEDGENAVEAQYLSESCDGEYIQYLGHRNDIKELLQTCHIVALPSYYREGIPKSLIEATAIGRPVITADSVGCRETVRDGYNGFLVPVRDSVVLAARLKELIDNPDLRREMGLNSRKYAEERFSIEEVIRTHLEIYRLMVSDE